MKKGLFLAAVAALTVALCSPMTVKAEGDSPTTGGDKGKIVITKQDGNGDIYVGDTGKDVNEKWGAKVDESLVVIFVGDAHIDPEKATTADPAEFKASKFGGTVIVHKGKTTEYGSSITLTVDDLSPVAVLAPKSSKGGKKSTNTADTSTNPIWAGALMISVLCAGAAVVMNKKNA